MDEISPERRLDIVLDVFRCYKDASLDDYIEIENIVPLVIKNGLIIDRGEIIKILLKLIKDGFIDKKVLDEHYKLYSYAITFDGKLFSGYKKQLKYDRVINRNHRIRVFLLAYGTALAGLYGLFEIVKWIVNYFLYK